MPSHESKIVQPITFRRPARFRGQLVSSDYNDFQDGVVHDITEIGSAVNTLNNQLGRLATVMYNETAYLRRLVDSLRNQQDYVERVGGAQGFLVSRLVDFSDTKGISFPGTTNDTYSAMISAEFGEATIPARAIENRFYTTSVRSGRVITPQDLLVIVRGSFDKGDGEGLVNYEKGGIVSEGTPQWAFNGNNQKYWIRRVEFPIDSRVDDVECELTVTVPEGTSTEAGVVEVVPFPNGAVDVTSLATSPDNSSVFTVVTGFSAEDNLVAKRYHFPVRIVERIRIRLRQRNWVEEEGKKVFYYGLQELGLKLVDYDKTYNRGAAFGQNHTFVVKIDAPEGYAFNQLYRIEPQPNFFREDPGLRHVHLRLSSSADFVGKFWDSDQNIPPQDAAVTLSVSNLSTMYAVIEMNYVDSTGGSLSPYPVGTTPYLRAIGLSYTLVRT